jgi:hypothetical protein
MEKNKCSRRSFIGKCLGISSLAAASTLVLSGCGQGKQDNSNEAKTTGGNPCDDLSGLTKEEIEQRKQFGYVKESSVPGSHCGNCRLFIPSDSEQECGGCLLFKGPVRATGYCTQYEAKT